MDAYVCGTSEEARALGKYLDAAMKSVEEGISDIERAQKTIGSAWNDEGYTQVEEMVSSLKKSLHTAKEGMPAVQKKIEKYAQFLEQK